MLCRNPYIHKGGSAYGCGQCMPCRINRRRLWTHRIMLESLCHSDSSFWTLTYDEDNEPKTEDDLGNLVPKDLTDFMKRLRFNNPGVTIRYFNVGEYGTQTGRPHYHLGLFGQPSCSRGVTQCDRRRNCCSVCDSVREIWGKGLVHSGKLESSSAAYIAGYVTKRLTQRGDSRLNGRHPEFARMSLKPGIGAGFMPEVASVVLHPSFPILTDVPTSLRHGTHVKPLGRYLTRLLRKQTGRDEAAPLEVQEAVVASLRPLRELALQVAPKGLYRETFSALLQEANEGRYQQLLAKQRLFGKKRELL